MQKQAGAQKKYTWLAMIYVASEVAFVPGLCNLKLMNVKKTIHRVCFLIHWVIIFLLLDVQHVFP